MSLTDVDKNLLNRSKPALNAEDGMPAEARMSHSTMGVTLKDENSTVVARVVFADGKVEVYRSDGTLVSRIGLRPSDSDGAVDVAKPSSAL